jgi:hypothetical protein
MSTTPMPGFHYIDFGERDDAAAGVASVEDDDCERIAQQFLSCSEAVREWPEFRRDAIRRKRLTPEICDGIERNVIAIFQEFVNILVAALESDDLRPISQPALRERLAHAHAYLALCAAPGNLDGYWKDFPELFDVQRAGSDMDGFMKALWEGAWNAPGEKAPAAVTFQEARNHRQQQVNDGLADRRRRRRLVAQLDQRLEIEDPRIVDAEPSPEHTVKQFAKIQKDFVKIGIANGLKKEQARFMAAMLEGKRAKDDRSAKKAINRKREPLLKETSAYLERFRRRF